MRCCSFPTPNFPRASVQRYWSFDVWYLGFELGAVADPKGAGPFRRLTSEGQLRTGAYQALVDDGDDLVELHALMAPRPFLASGGTAHLPERWPCAWVWIGLTSPV